MIFSMSSLEKIQKLEKKIAFLFSLHEAGKSLTSTLDFKTVLELVTKKTYALFQATTSLLFLVDSVQQDLYCKVVIGKNSKNLKNMRFKIGEGTMGCIAQTDEIYVVKNNAENANKLAEINSFFPNRIRSLVCIPLKTKHGVLGIIALVNCVEETFHHEDVFLLSTIADYSAIAIENAMYVEQIQDLIITDDCTNLYNIRHFNEVIDKELTRSKRYNQSLSLVLFDLDHFKKVNDTHGHICGSLLLKEIGNLVKRNLRDIDSAYRYGGDEFILLLPQTSKRDAFKVAERFCDLFARTSIKLKKDVHVKITASFGVTSFPEDGNDRNKLVFLADQAIYQVKQRNRNDVGVA